MACKYYKNIIGSVTKYTQCPSTKHKQNIAQSKHVRLDGDVMSMSRWSLRWHFTNKSITGASYSIKSYSLSQLDTMVKSMMTVTCSAVLRSLWNCSSDGAERTDDGRAFHIRAAVTRKARSPSVVRRVDGGLVQWWPLLAGWDWDLW